jgi:hypothetical protein
LLTTTVGGRGRGRPGPPRDLLVGQALLQQVRDPQGQAVEHHLGAGRGPAQGHLQLEGLLDGLPAGRPLGPVAADALGHLGVPGLGGDDHRDRAVPAGGQPLGQGRLAAAGAAEEQGHGHQ